MTYRRFNAVCEPIFLRLIESRPTPAERLDWAEIAHQHNQISDEQLARFEREAARVSA